MPFNFYKLILAPAAITAALMSTVTMAQTSASITPANAPVPKIGTAANAISANAKKVKFAIRNDSSAPMKLRVGDEHMTLLPQQSMEVRLRVGEQIINMGNSTNHQQGEVLMTVIKDLDGNTVAFR